MSGFLTGHSELLRHGKLDEALRMSGEHLAETEATMCTLSTQSDGSAKADAARAFLEAAYIHICDLGQVGMARDVAALAVMSPATLIMMKVNPESIADEYVGWLQLAVGLLGDIVEELHAVELADGYWHLAQLAVATHNDYCRRFTLRNGLAERNELIERQLRQVHPDSIKFNGSEIVPHLALDIFADILSAMSALHWLGD